MFFNLVKKSHLNCKYFYLLLIVLTVNSSFAQSLSQLEKKAVESFNKKDYGSALIDFRQLLAQNPSSMDFNFKYGVCVFYSDNRKNAKRYFDFVERCCEQFPNVILIMGNHEHYHANADSTSIFASVVGGRERAAVRRDRLGQVPCFPPAARRAPEKRRAGARHQCTPQAPARRGAGADT